MASGPKRRASDGAAPPSPVPVPVDAAPEDADLIVLPEPDAGAVLINGTDDLSTLDVVAWRDTLAWVPQRPSPTQRTGRGNRPTIFPRTRLAPSRSWMPAVPFKLNRDRRHHIPRQTHKVTNWPASACCMEVGGTVGSAAVPAAGTVRNFVCGP